MNAFPPIDDFATFLKNRKVAENTFAFIAMFATLLTLVVEIAVAFVGEWWVNGGKEKTFETFAFAKEISKKWADAGKVKLVEFYGYAKEKVAKWWVEEGEAQFAELCNNVKTFATNEMNYTGFIVKEWWNDAGKPYALATVNRAKVAVFAKAL